jgi:hypothetical protein
MNSDFNWVKARAECSAAQVFKELELGAKEDVEKRNLLRSPEEQFRFLVAQAGPDRFAVIREAARGSRSVDFMLAHSIISVDAGLSKFSGVITLNNFGECRLRVGNDELEQWQFRRKALEQLFFSEIQIQLERIGGSPKE